jgi:hypothetical protein
MIWRALMILLLFYAPCTWAQQSKASYEFFNMNSECAASLGGWKCLELDLSSETALKNDSTKKYLYSWTMGDGNRKQGDKIEHCYDQFGSYQVKMDLIDPEANIVIRNELSATVDLYPEIHPVVEMRSSNAFASFLEFDCGYNDPEVFEPDNVYWRIDGKYYEGKTVAHAFHVAGTYLIEMGIEKNTELTGTLTACATREITIRESDIWTTQIVTFLEKKRAEYVTGPFSKDDVFCLLVPLDQQKESMIVPINFLMSRAHLAKDREYEVLLFSGNVFTKTKKLKTHGLIGNELYAALKDTVSSFVDEPVMVFAGLIIKGSNASDVLSTEGIKRTASLLTQNPLLRIEIGSYIHSGSRIEKGIHASLQKALAVKDLLTRNGISAQRISIASPENNRVLVNTCSAMPDCALENPALNDKVEFKITGTTL